jgi:hypothetical protein
MFVTTYNDLTSTYLSNNIITNLEQFINTDLLIKEMYGESLYIIGSTHSISKVTLYPRNIYEVLVVAEWLRIYIYKYRKQKW